ncbi:MAG: SUMF1/EgtB/PvdO family nonheme iron enzyme [Candidatus Cloacimonetes bacterium]|nr:SUMF1/EgtB/PvdO family nonheme iron enzyme [Candidatus Cloacimonadota bacterium]
MKSRTNHLFISLISLCVVAPILAQSITNVNTIRPNNSCYQVSYDLNAGNADNGQLYNIVVEAKNGLKEITPMAFGDGVTAPTTAGPGKTILWDPESEGLPAENWTLDLSLVTVPKGMVFVEGGEYLRLREIVPEHDWVREMEDCRYDQWLYKLGYPTSYPEQTPRTLYNVGSFFMSQDEVTVDEWNELMGPDLQISEPGNYPACTFFRSDAIDYCNRRSKAEGLTPYYLIKEDPEFSNYSDLAKIGWIISVDPRADGYRLPTEIEWEYAASGGIRGNGYIYAGSDEIDEVAWYAGNSDGALQPVGLLKPNELGIHDLTGNAWEWCWGQMPQWPETPYSGWYILKGGSAEDLNHDCRIFVTAYDHSIGGNYRYAGFRLVRNSSQ